MSTNVFAYSNKKSRQIHIVIIHNTDYNMMSRECGIRYLEFGSAKSIITSFIHT